MARKIQGLRSAMVAAFALASFASAQAPQPVSVTTPPAAQPWMNKALSPDQRADLVLAQMTQDEKIQLVHGTGRSPPQSNGGAGYVPGIKRLGIPDLNMADSSVGVGRGAARGRYSTLMPASLAEAASWDPKIAYDYGALIGRELRAQGYNVSLAGGVNLMREPRGSRSFEYRGEDPLLAGKLAGQWIRGVQDQHVIGTIKHFALNDQETGRMVSNAVLDERSLRESDLLAFEVGVKEGQPGMVMCSYNRVNGDWSCENDYLLNRTLKQDWGFKGFVLSDWNATHSTVKAANAGLDQEQPGEAYYGPALKQAIASGALPQARLDDMVRRILRTMIVSGIVDDPPTSQVVDVFAGLEASRRTAEAGAVLLKNSNALPIASTVRSIAVIGGHADVGVLTGGGSAQVDPPGGSAVALANPRSPVWYPSSPLRAITAKAVGARVTYDAGTDPAAAAAAARNADVAIVFAIQPSREEGDRADHADLSLPDNQDALIAAVAANNPRTIVVLQTGGPVTMPWIDRVAAVTEVWFPGASGGEAIANLLFGAVNFSGKLPITFPRSEVDLPLPVLAGSMLTPIPQQAPPGGVAPLNAAGQPVMTLPLFDIVYPEKSAVGYKWYELKKKAPLFAFGHGLSYTSYEYAGLTATQSEARFTVTNTGARAGEEIAQVYATIPGGNQPRRLVGWSKIALKAGESKTVTVPIDPMYLSMWDVKARAWKLQRGDYRLSVGPASNNTPMAAAFRVQ